MIRYVALFSIVLLAIQLIQAFINFVFRQKLSSSTTKPNEKVSILIPARNEAMNIPNILTDLTQMADPKFEILVFDDQSIDDTASIVSRFAHEDKRIRLISSTGLPDGWTGKNYACYQLAKHATGSYYVFLDADVRVEGTVLRDAIEYMKEKRLSLLSIFPQQITLSIGEKSTVPLMHYILLTLLPLIFVRLSPFRSHAAANGQCMIFNASDYQTLQPHELFKNSLVEDIAIAQFLKGKKYSVACITGEKRIKCRMYHSYKEALNGFAKNIFTFFGNFPLLAFLFWIFSGFGFLFVFWGLPCYGWYYLLMLLATLILYSAACKQKFVEGVVFFPVQMGFFFHVMIYALWMQHRKNYLWKERNIR